MIIATHVRPLPLRLGSRCLRRQPPHAHNTTTANNDFDYPVRASIESPYTASHPTAGAGAGAYDARNTNSHGYARAPGEDHDEEEDDDEDWNVYDDFNMTRPMPHRSSTSGLASQNDATGMRASLRSSRRPTRMYRATASRFCPRRRLDSMFAMRIHDAPSSSSRPTLQVPQQSILRSRLQHQHE